MTHRIIKARVLVALVLCALLVQACADKDLKKIANALEDTGLAIAAIQKTAIAANLNGLASVNDTRAVVEFTVKLNDAGKEASRITRKFTMLAPEDRARIGQIFDPLLKELITARAPVQLIRDDKTRDTLLASLTAIETSLTIVKLSLER